MWVTFHIFFVKMDNKNVTMALHALKNWLLYPLFIFPPIWTFLASLNPQTPSSLKILWSTKSWSHKVKNRNYYSETGLWYCQFKLLRLALLLNWPLKTRTTWWLCLSRRTAHHNLALTPPVTSFWMSIYNSVSCCCGCCLSLHHRSLSYV